MWRPAAAELLATFLFVFLGAGTVVVSGVLTNGELTAARLVIIAFGHGLAFALLIAAIVHISGGHINPAITFAALITRKISVEQGVLYIAAQLIGGIAGALLLVAVIPSAMGGELGEGGLGTHALGAGVEAWQGVLIEITLTAVLVFVVFGAAMDKRGLGNVAPIAIGLAVVVVNLVGVPLTGAAINPARTLGPALAAGEWADHWVYWAGPLAGAAIAGLVYKYVFEEKSS